MPRREGGRTRRAQRAGPAPRSGSGRPFSGFASSAGARYWERRSREAAELLKAIKRHMRALKDWASDSIDSMWGYEDGMYRFYHRSFKVQYLQDPVQRAVRLFRRIRSSGLNRDFEAIVTRGLARDATPSEIVTAFLHTKYFVEMMLRYGAELDEPPSVLPSGWASILYLYNLR